MIQSDMPANPYVLLTPGPLSTTPTVKEVMLRDWCTWDTEYNDIVQDIRRRLVELATVHHRAAYTSVLMQGSGTFCVEAALGTAIPADGKVLVVANGAYGERMATIAGRLRIPHGVLQSLTSPSCIAKPRRAYSIHWKRLRLLSEKAVAASLSMQ